MRVLVVEDEPKMATLVARGLREEGHAADVASDGEDALWMAGATRYDAIVLDVMLPGLDGFATCRRLRERGVWAPVLMLTARDAVGDRVDGLDAGADDYLLKPFSFSELLARLRALVRRAPAERPTLLEAGDLRLDPAARRAWRGETELELSTKVFALLELMLRRRGEALSRGQLLEGAPGSWASRAARISSMSTSATYATRRAMKSHYTSSTRGPACPSISPRMRSTASAAPTGRGARAGPAWGWQSSI